MTRLVQLKRNGVRRVAVVEEPHLRLLAEASSVYALAQAAIAANASLTSIVNTHKSDDSVDYDAVYHGSSEWKLLPPIDHPEERSRCLVSGTGLTHLGSALNRQKMHGNEEGEEEDWTDSMRMFRAGLEGGKPDIGSIGVAPEWFYKGDGGILRAHGEPLVVPCHAEDGGEEAEIAAIYLIAANGHPYRLGMAIGNEFSDHVLEKTNYLNLAGSKLRPCALGPELIVNPRFQSVTGSVTIQRDSEIIWSKPIQTGENEMCHSLQNIEHHHFKFESHRRPGDMHVHYLGAHSLSFGDGIKLVEGDEMTIAFEDFGRPLQNPLQIEPSSQRPINIHPMT